jgi:hypothetical protein
MSELIKKFRPPTIPKHRIEKGIRYVDSGVQTDWMGQTLEVGDVVIYGKGIGIYVIAKVIGVYTKMYPNGDKEPRLETTISIATDSTTWTGEKRIGRQGTSPDNLIKLFPSQYGDKVTDEFLKA